MDSLPPPSTRPADGLHGGGAVRAPLRRPSVPYLVTLVAAVLGAVIVCGESADVAEIFSDAIRTGWWPAGPGGS